jgi:His Kinase A (phospho-acceptor) domain
MLIAHFIRQFSQALFRTRSCEPDDASHHLRTPITIALTHAELLARDLDGRELRDMQTVLGEITRLRRLSERLLVIAAAEDPDFLRTEPVLLDEFAVELSSVSTRGTVSASSTGALFATQMPNQR